MNIKSIIKPCLAIIFLSNSLLTYAADQQVFCPTAVSVKNEWQHLDTVQLLNDKDFLVYSYSDSFYDESSKLWWQIGSNVSASDFNTAFTMGTNNVKNILTVKDKYATDVGGLYSCVYLDNTGKLTVYAISDIHEKSSKIKKAMLNLN